ncbi:neuroligin-4, X-linked-like [Montipora capricornis]|uniref:neuroligin-4, X-linked-like n=1 Tax=Montipora capricornis TaxID=246305 RepID=UPI0035F1A3E5
MSESQLEKFLFFAFLPLACSVTVSTKYGDIEGFKASYPNVSGPFKDVSKFLGVPFAAPPTGELRFKAPQPLPAWKPNVHKAKKHGNVCIQGKLFDSFMRMFALNFSYSEDCLYLDVYSPNVSSSLPVMVYIHGGAYQSGSAIAFQSDILALQGVVVVIIQYRLGPFGFLTTGDSAAPGNFGMLDQVEALKWVKENIANFGGNPNKVTIFGESAGGSSVGLHLLSPLSKDLFQQAIAESGVDLSPFATQPSSFGLRSTKELAHKLSCPSSNHNIMVDCIRGKTATEVHTAAQLIPQRLTLEINFAPVVDSNFLHDTPTNLRQQGKFIKVPLMMCFTSHEASSFLATLVNNSFHLMQSISNGVSPALFKSFLTSFADSESNRKGTADLLRSAVEFMYTPWPDNNDKFALRSQLVNVFGDYVFYAPSHEVADIHSKYASVYMYEFAHPATFSVARTEPWMGVPHAENVPFDFGMPLLPMFSSRYSEADRNVSLLIMAIHVNFARSGDPTLGNIPWERYNSSHRAYLKVDPNPKMAESFNPRRMAFWNDYYPKLTQVRIESDKEVISGASRGVTIGTFLLIVVINFTSAIVLM